MWNVFRELPDGSREEVSFVNESEESVGEEQASFTTQSGENVTAQLVHDTVLKLKKSAEQENDIPAFHFINQEVELSREMDGLPGRDAIAIWGRNIAESPIELGSLNPESVTDIGEETPSSTVQERVVFEDDALKWQFGTNGNYDNFRTIAWHDKTLVVIRVPEEYQDDSFILEYTPEDNETLPSAEQYQGESIAFVEWRGYLGSNSFVCDFISKFCQVKNFITTLKTKGKGFYVGMVVRLLYGDSPGRFENDPTFNLRLRKVTDKYSQLAKQCPRLDNVNSFNDEYCIVFVHGAFACGLNQLNLLYPEDKFQNRKPPVPTYRFEHDTFRSIPENADKLRQLIQKKIPKCEHLLLIGHSRGGLVCRLAAILLENDNYNSKLDIWTYGTPHEGTPLVDAGLRLLRWLPSLTAKIFDGIPKYSLVEALFLYLVQFYIESKTEDLPKGIAEMSPSSTLQEILELIQPKPTNIRSYGGNYDANKNNGYKVVVDDTLDGFFLNNANDLVVTQKSATAVGIGENIQENCAHLGYFEIDRLRNEIYLYCHFSKINQKQININNASEFVRDLINDFKKLKLNPQEILDILLYDVLILH